MISEDALLLKNYESKFDAMTRLLKLTGCILYGILEKAIIIYLIKNPLSFIETDSSSALSKHATGSYSEPSLCRSDITKLLGVPHNHPYISILALRLCLDLTDSFLRNSK
jgi:hypothetical protein